MFSSSSYIFVQLACKSENCQGFSENSLSRDCVVVSEFSFLNFPKHWQHFGRMKISLFGRKNSRKSGFSTPTQ